jgi:hypothetical protein
MTTPTTPISLSDVNNELGYPTTQTVSLGDQYVTVLGGGNHDMNDLRNKTSHLFSGSVNIGYNFTPALDAYGNPVGYDAPGFDFGGYNHGSVNTPYLSFTSSCARPMNLSGYVQFLAGGNNYVHFRLFKSDGTLLVDSGTVQIGIYASPTVFTYYFNDTIPPYGTNYYYMNSYCNGNGDYNNMKTNDGGGPLVIYSSSYAG